MSEMDRRELEIATLVMAVVAEEAEPQDRAKLNHLLETCPDLSSFVVDLLAQEAWLTWSSASARSGAVRKELADHIAEVAQATQMECDDLIEAVLGSCHDSRKPLISQPQHTAAARTSAPGTKTLHALAACLLVSIGALLGWRIQGWLKPSTPAVAWENVAPLPNAPAEGPYVARLVQGTACLWTPESAMLQGFDATLRTGESLKLLEGLAEVRLDWANGGADLQIEGPAGLVLTAERGASLTHGKFTIDVEQTEDPFVLDTPNGEVEVSAHSSIGVAVIGSDVEVHVFRGNARFITPWTTGADSTERLDINTGESLSVATNRDGRMEVTSAAARSDRFASKLSMRSDSLFISPQYVNEVLAGKPLLYWRFEGAHDGLVPNEVGPKYNGRVVGSPEWLEQGGNRHVALGAGLTSEELGAYIAATESFQNELGDAYSVEFWFKPSHYHWGTILSMLGPPLQPGWQSTHGLLLELGGPRAAETAIERPGKVRFLHRNPPSDDPNQGTSCFSDVAYQLRKWQHLVVVKEDQNMRLYLNGVLTATKDDPTDMAPGLQVLVGQLDENRDYRRFVGQLDELAVFPRALDEAEVFKHYQLVRSPETPHRVISTDIF